MKQEQEENGESKTEDELAHEGLEIVSAEQKCAGEVVNDHDSDHNEEGKCDLFVFLAVTVR